MWDRVSCNPYPAVGTRVSHRIESAATPIQLPELESAIGWSQPQLVSNGCNLYPAARTWVNRRMESAVTCIQSPELDSVVTWIQPSGPQTAANRMQPPKLGLPAGITSCNSYSAPENRVSRRIESAAAVTRRSSILDENPGYPISYEAVEVKDHKGIMCLS